MWKSLQRILLWFYQRYFIYQLSRSSTKVPKLPSTMAFIVDGNRRYAKQNGISYDQSYDIAGKKVFRVAEYCREYKIKNCIVWLMSISNFSRPSEEVDILMNVFERFYNWDTGYTKNLHDQNCSIHFIGDFSVIPEKYKSLKETFRICVEKTKHNTGTRFITAIGYDGQNELTRVCNEIAPTFAVKGTATFSFDEINRSTDLAKLNVDPPDIIVRTGGNKRLSNFLNWDSGKSSLYFINKQFPAFEKLDFVQALLSWKKDQNT